MKPSLLAYCTLSMASGFPRRGCAAFVTLLVLLVCARPLASGRPSGDGSPDPSQDPLGRSQEPAVSAAAVNAGPESALPGRPPEVRLLVFLPERHGPPLCGLDAWRPGEQRCLERADLLSISPDASIRGQKSPLLMTGLPPDLVMDALSRNYFLLMQDIASRWTASPERVRASLERGLTLAGATRLPAPASSYQLLTAADLINAISSSPEERADSSAGVRPFAAALFPGSLLIDAPPCHPLEYRAQDGLSPSRTDLFAPSVSLCTDSLARYFKLRGRDQYREGQFFDVDLGSSNGPFLDQVYPVHLSPAPPWPDRLVDIAWPLLERPDLEPWVSSQHRRRFDDVYSRVQDQLMAGVLRYGPTAYSTVQLRTLGALTLMNTAVPIQLEDASMRPENAGDLGSTDPAVLEPTRARDAARLFLDGEWRFALAPLDPSLVKRELYPWLLAPPWLGPADLAETSRILSIRLAQWETYVSTGAALEATPGATPGVTPGGAAFLTNHRLPNRPLEGEEGQLIRSLMSLLSCHAAYPGDDLLLERDTCITRSDLSRSAADKGLLEQLPTSLRLADWEWLIQRLDRDEKDGLRPRLYRQILSFFVDQIQQQVLEAEIFPVLPQEVNVGPLPPQHRIAPDAPDDVAKILHAWEWMFADTLPADFSRLPPPESGARALQVLARGVAQYVSTLIPCEAPVWTHQWSPSLELAIRQATQTRRIYERYRLEDDARRLQQAERRAWRLLYEEGARAASGLPPEWPSSLRADALAALGEEGAPQAITRRTGLLRSLAPLLADLVVDAHRESLSRIDSSPLQRDAELALRVRVISSLPRLLRLDSAEFPPQAASLSLRYGALALRTFLSNPEDLQALPACRQLTAQSPLDQLLDCQILALADRRGVPNHRRDAYQQTLRRSVLEALVGTLSPPGQRTYRRWLFQRHALSDLGLVIRGRRAWTPKELQDTLAEEWSAFLSRHGLVGRLLEPGSLPSVNPLAVCSSPVASPDERLEEPSIRPITLDVVFEAEAGLTNPRDALWQARERLPFIELDGNLTARDAVENAHPPQLIPLFTIPPKGQSTSAPKRAIYLSRWQVWSGWHLFHTVGRPPAATDNPTPEIATASEYSAPSPRVLPGLRTGALCADTLLIERDLEASLLRWALLKDAAPTLPFSKAQATSEEEDALAASLERSRQEQAIQQGLSAEEGTLEVLNATVGDVLPVANDKRALPSPANTGYAALTLEQSRLRDRLRLFLQESERSQRFGPAGATSPPSLLLAFDVRRRQESDVDDRRSLLYRRSPYFQTASRAEGEEEPVSVDVAGWAYALAETREPHRWVSVAPDYRPPMDPRAAPDLLFWKPHVPRDLVLTAALGQGLRTVSGLERTLSDAELGTVGVSLDGAPYTYVDQPLALQVGAHLTWWISDRGRLGVESGAISRLELLLPGMSLIGTDPMTVDGGSSSETLLTLKPGAGFSVGIALLPTPDLLTRGRPLHAPWGTPRALSFTQRLSRLRYGARLHTLGSLSMGQLETSFGLELYALTSLRKRTGLLAAFTPYAPRAGLGLYLAADRGTYLGFEPDSYLAFYPELESVWLFSFGLSSELRLLDLQPLKSGGNR